MKPLLIKIPIESLGKVNITFQELEDIVQRAYDQGYEDGKHVNLSVGYPPPLNYPYVPTEYNTITACDSNNLSEEFK